MVVQINLQRIDGAEVNVFFNLTPSVGQQDLQTSVFGRQLEPQTASGNDLRIDLDGGGFGAQFFVAKLGQRSRPQTELHAVQSRHRLRFNKQQPNHHALDVFELNIKGRVDQHRALHPFGAEVQKTDVAVV